MKVRSITCECGKVFKDVDNLWIEFHTHVKEVHTRKEPVKSQLQYV